MVFRGYFDESGLHDTTTGHLTNLTIGVAWNPSIDGRRSLSIAVGKPELLCELQAADPIAYEFSRSQRQTYFGKRYPLQRIREAAETFVLATRGTFEVI